jgi:tetratricopeptide (TPR) repeat protein
LVRDAAYQRVSKDARADLHERYASWVAQRQREQAPEIDEVVGYHLEKAYQHRVELGRLDARTRALGQRAGERLTTAGRRAAARGDIPATAAALLARAIELLPQDHQGRLGALLDLADALREAENLADALRTYQVALEVAEGSDNERGRAHAVVGRMDALWFHDPVDMLTNGPLEAERAVRVLQRFQDDLGLARAWRLLAYVHFAAGKATAAQEAAERAITAARRVGDEHWQARIVRLQCVIRFWGPEPLSEVIRYNEQALEWAKRTGMRTLEACALRILARAAAMEGRFDEARGHNKAADAIKPDLGELLTWAADSISRGLVELAAGRLEEAEQALQQGFEKASRTGAAGHLTSIAALLARVHLRQGHDEEAETIARICEQVAPATQLDPQIKARAIRAVVLSRHGQRERAESLAREAMAMAEHSEQLNSQAETLQDLAEVLRNIGRLEEAEQVIERGIRCFERKGNLVGAANARGMQAELAQLRSASED